MKAVEVKEHRIKRYDELLTLLGKELGFECIWPNREANEVVWEATSGATCSFKITEKHIVVRASRPLHGQEMASEVGTIVHHEFEKALWTWCKRNPERGDQLQKALYEPAQDFPEPEPPQHLLWRVLENREWGPEYYVLTFGVGGRSRIDPQPGQFMHVVCDPDGKDTLTDDGRRRGYALTLRRPFSVHRVHYAGFDRRLLATPKMLPFEISHIIRRPLSKMDILYKLVGEGTRSLSRVQPGRLLDVIGPLGNGFNIERERTAIIVAGGIGVAPLVALAERLRYLGTEVYMYLGAVTQEHLQPILRDAAVQRGFIHGTEFCERIMREFEEIGIDVVKVCTDDGTVGEKGLVTDILEGDIEAGSIPSHSVTMYACGPLAMMKRVSDVARKHAIPCQVLLEERMACGVGTCFSCTCRIRGKDGKVEKKRVCKDGPGFNSEDIVW